MVAPPKARDKLDMKLHNRALVWNLIVNARPISRARLAKITEMSPTTITRIVGELLSFGLLVESPDTHVGVGRKATLLDINGGALFTVGIDIDVRSVKTCLLDLDSRPRIILERHYDREFQPPESIVRTALDLYAEMLAATGVSRDKVKAVGVSVSGQVDPGRGILRLSPQLHWKNVELRRVVEEAFGIPAIIENDAKAAIYEEYIRHAECRANNVACLIVGCGVGAAIMYEGKLLRGGSNAAGEIGHTTVYPGGELCDCGRYGCLYTCLSEKHIIARIRRLSGQENAMEQWVAAQKAGEQWATGLANETAGYIAMALNQLLCSYDPQIIILGGKLIHANPDLLPMALGKKGLIFEGLGSDVQIFSSLSPNQDSLVGAAIIARTAFLEKLLHDITT